MPPVTMRSPDGAVVDVPEDQISTLVDRGYTVEGAAERSARVADTAREEYYSTPSQKVRATYAAVARGGTLGISDAIGRAVGAGDTLRGLRDANPTLSTVGEIGGALLTGKVPLAPASLATRAGSAIAKTAEGAGVITKLARAAGGASAEGFIYGAGSGVSELSLSKDKLTLERIGSVMSSHTLFGAGVGAGAGLLTKGVEIGLSRAARKLDDIAARSASPQAADDLAKLDAKGLRAAEKTERESLRAAEKTELEGLRTAEKAELDAIEASRNLERKSVADEISAFRQEIKDQRHFLTTKDVSLPAVEGRASAAELGRKAAKATRQLDNLLDNPAGLAQRPERALDALQRHEDAMTKLLDRADDLRTVFRADASGARAAALDAIPAALERNRALQQKLQAFSAKPTSAKLEEIIAKREAIQAGSMRTSQRLDDIAAARDAASGGGSSMIGNMVGGTAFGAVANVVGSLVPIPGVAALAGGAAAKFINGGLTKAITGQAARISAAVGAVASAARHAGKVAPVLATKTLSRVAFSDDPKPTRGLAPSYKARTDEIKRLTQFTPDGNVEMRPAAREQVAKRLDPIRKADPILADRLETIAARKVEYLSRIIPRRPDVGGLPIGPDIWQPSSMEMRSWARSVAAVEDPVGVFERVANGAVTPEDVDAVKNVYPEMYADFQQQVFMRLPELRKTLPFAKRVALSIFTGQPVDASMHPAVLGVLQSTFANETGSDGGTTAPTPQPQFGSVKAEAATPAQERAT